MSRASGLVVVLAVVAVGCTAGGEEGTTTTFDPLVLLPFPIDDVDPGDATETEIDVLFRIPAAMIRNDVSDLEEVFALNATFDPGLLSAWEGRTEIVQGLDRWIAIRSIWNMYDFTRVGDRLVFNWEVQHYNDGPVNQGVEVLFADDRIKSLEVTSVAIPYCIGLTQSGCKDYDTGEVIPLDLGDLPDCPPNVRGECGGP